MVFFKVAACLALAATAFGAPQVSRLIDNPDFNPTGLTEAELAAQMFDPDPQYTYSYQVAADPQQTYIAMQESRDGEDVAGEYSYVDPLGNLITVTYTAGVMGYQESRSVQENFVKIRAAPTVKVEEVVQQVVETNAGASDSDLVASIIAQLTPFIKNTVSTSLGGSSSSSSSSSLGSSATIVSAAPAVTSSRTVVSSVPSTTSSRTVVSSVPATTATRTVISSAPVVSSSSSTSATSAIFGTGGANNVAFETPEFTFNYDLTK